MRWIAFVLLSILAVATQTSVGAALRLPVGEGLVFAIDFLAILAVLVALRAREASDAVGAAWLLGLLVDLASVGSPLGMYALAYAGAAALVFHTRGAVFSESALAQVLVTTAFCLIAHGLARGFMNLYVRSSAQWLGRDLLQCVLVTVATAAAAPFVLGVLKRVDWLIMVQPGWRRR